MICKGCARVLGETDRFCSRCGTPTDGIADSPTGTAPRGASPATSRRGSNDRGLRLSSTTPADTRFAAGEVLVGRYRVVGLLGKGGMGEVYRADDLTLGQAVALKFLPQRLATSPERRARLFSEVRLAREITHPSVVRVHDVYELDGQPFLSMEYVDGENLASLLRRAGRPSPERALEIARQICAGVAAAHERGVLHRDLKPENVMIDGRGRARVMDFGLAGLAEELQGEEVRSGTPAYMSPEQLEGREVSARSDVYALGLVLFELFTGKRAFVARSLPELQRLHREEAPPRPAEVVPGIDAAVEAAILRCLEKQPLQRPASALAVAAALPGGDPLAAALAAGETPSPELVAAAGVEGRLSPRVATSLLVASVVGAVLAVFLALPVQLLHRIPFEKSPEVLADRAREVLAGLGAGGDAADSAFGYAVDLDFFERRLARGTPGRRWAGFETGWPPLVTFWYRVSPRPLAPSGLRGRAEPSDPPLDVSGMALIQLDTLGRLVQLVAVPPQREAPAAEPAAELDWSDLFASAGLDPERFRAAAPSWTPPTWADARVAWEGTAAEAPELVVRVEAAAYRGRPIYFRLVFPWTRPERMQRLELPAALEASWAVGTGFVILVLTAGFLLARHNLRKGRGDRRAAWRSAGLTFAGMMGVWLLRAHHVLDFGDEMLLLVRGLGLALVVSAVLWVLYMGLEPFVRRLWPELLISWTRLFVHGPGDPLVGRHVLLGAAAGSLAAVLIDLGQYAPIWLGEGEALPRLGSPDPLLGLRHLLGTLLGQAVNALLFGMGAALFLLLARLLLRRRLLAELCLAGLFGVQAGLELQAASLSPAWSIPLGTLAWLPPSLVLGRLGLLPFVALLYCANLLLSFPLLPELGRWYSGPTLALLATVGLLTLYGFRGAVGRARGRSARVS